MTELLERALHRLRDLPAERQDELASLLLSLTLGEPGPYHLTKDEEVDLAEAEAEVDRGELASDTDVRNLWAKYGA